jgi:hypothetical protein
LLSESSVEADPYDDGASKVVPAAAAPRVQR